MTMTIISILDDKGRKWYIDSCPIKPLPYWSIVACDVRDEHKMDSKSFNGMIWYLGLCESAGFAKTEDQIRLCAKRFVAGKRKVTAPGTQRRKDEAIRVKKALLNVSAELRAAIDQVATSDIFKQVVGGNEKAKNSLMGMVMRIHKTDAKLIMQLLDIEIAKHRL